MRIAFLRKALDLVREQLPSRRELVAQAANWLGAVEVALQAYPEAENHLLTETQEFLAPNLQMSTAERRAAVEHIVRLYNALGKKQQADEWQRKLDEIPLPSAK